MELRKKNKKPISPATANRYLTALRGVLRACWRQGRMDSETYHRAVDLPPVPGTSGLAGREIGSDEIEHLFVEISLAQEPVRSRDATMVGLMVAGLRRAEVASLDLGDYDRELHRLEIRGKRNRVRHIFINNGLGRALHGWLLQRGSEPGPLLCQVDKHGHVRLERLTPAAIYMRLRWLVARAGLKM